MTNFVSNIYEMILREAIPDPFKISTSSYAWLSPEGSLFEIDTEIFKHGHLSWVENYLNERGIEYSGGEDDIRRILIDMNWIRIVNAYIFNVKNIKTMPKDYNIKQIKTILELIKNSKHKNKDYKNILIDDENKTIEIHPADFARIFLNQKEVDLILYA